MMEETKIRLDTIEESTVHIEDVNFMTVRASGNTT